MTVRLVSLRCPTCAEPLRIPPDEVAFSCGCGATLAIGEAGAVPIEVRWTGDSGLPWWCVTAEVEVSVRRTTEGPASADPLWDGPARIWVPAYEPNVQTAIRLGVERTRHQLAYEPVTPSASARLTGCVVPAERAPALAELVALTIEADKRDTLVEIALEVRAGPPALWVLA